MALSQALAGGKATRSLFPDYSPYFSDASDQHGDLTAARALLDEAGWTLSGGKRSKVCAVKSQKVADEDVSDAYFAASLAFAALALYA